MQIDIRVSLGDTPKLLVWTYCWQILTIFVCVKTYTGVLYSIKTLFESIAMLLYRCSVAMCMILAGADKTNHIYYLHCM